MTLDGKMYFASADNIRKHLEVLLFCDEVVEIAGWGNKAGERRVIR
jgi:hypothetical protein